MKVDRRSVNRIIATGLFGIFSGCISSDFRSNEETESDSELETQSTTSSSKSTSTGSEPHSTKQHQPHSIDLLIENYTDEEHSITVSIETDSDEVVFTESQQLNAGEKASFNDAIPASSDGSEGYIVTVTLEGTTKTKRVTAGSGTGIHSLNVEIDSGGDVSIIEIVH